MAFGLTTPITGSAQTGLTAPTYSILVDTPPDINAKQFMIVGIGGTQTGVGVSSVALPFTTAFFKPKVFKVLGKANPITGVINNVPMNVFKHVSRKGVIYLAGQPAKPMIITTMIEVPAGADAADPNSVRAVLSMHIGSLTQASAGIGDTLINGLL